MSETSVSQQEKKTSKTKAFKKGISKLVKSPKKSHPAILTFNDGGATNNGNRSSTLAFDHRGRQTRSHEGILKRSKSLNQIDNKEDDDTESLNSAATISVFRSVHFDSTKNLEQGKISDAGWASSSKTSTSNGGGAPRIIVHDSHEYIEPNVRNITSVNPTGNSDYTDLAERSNLNSEGASTDHFHAWSHRSATLPRNTKLHSFSDSSDGAINSGTSHQNGDQIQRSHTVSRSKDLDNLGVIKLVASTQNLATVPAPTSPPVTTVPIQSPQGITAAQLRELEERIERKLRRTVDKILKKQRETGAPSLSGTNQKLTVWEAMVLEIQRSMETLYIEKVQKEKHLIRKEIIKKLEAEKRPTQEDGTQANLTVVEARPFIMPQEVQHTDFESQTQNKEHEQTEMIESLNARLRNLQADYDNLRANYNEKLEEIEKMRMEQSDYKKLRENYNEKLEEIEKIRKEQADYDKLRANYNQKLDEIDKMRMEQADYNKLRSNYNEKLEQMEKMRMELSRYNRSTSNLITATDETPTYVAGTQTNELAEKEIIQDLQMKLAQLESEHQRIESLKQVDYNKLRAHYNEKLEEIEKLHMELSRHNRSTSNLVTSTEETPSYVAGTQTNELAETEIILDLQMKLAQLEREHRRIESMYEEKVTEINTLTLEYQQNVMNLEGQIKQVPRTANVKLQASPDVYDAGIQSHIRTSDLWTYTEAGKIYPDSSDLQIQVNTVTRDEGSETVPTVQFDVGLQCIPATRDASDSTVLSMDDLEEMEEYASLYRLEKEETEIITKKVRSETPELPDNSLILKYLETSGNRSDDMITAVGALLKSDEAHTVSLESMRYMDVETTTDRTSEDSGYYPKVINSNGYGESNRPMSSLKFNNLHQETSYGINGDGYMSDRELTGGNKGYLHSTSGTFFSDTERTTKLTSTPQSDYDYSFEINTSRMSRPSFESNGTSSTERPMRRFLKYGLVGQQQQPVIDLRTHNYEP